ncbi:MAG: ATP-binding protein [Desulfobacterales bacterium]|nr:ATP-binding protein [Desulfobacterales bacterium]
MFTILKKFNFWNNEPIRTGFFRANYINIFSKYLNNSLVKVILGQRRVGKSYLLRMLIEYLIKQNHVAPERILYINKDIHELEFINNSQQLLNVIEEYKNTLKPQGKIYVFLDEVQEIKDWEKSVNSLSQDYTTEYELFITGSNANLLSTELSTYLSGRYICFEVLPFSYDEFLGMLQLQRSKASFIEYLKSGGMPEVLTLQDPEIKSNYVKSLLDSIVLRDIVQRYNVRDVYLLEKLIAFTIDSIGSYVSIHSIVNYLKSSGYKTNSETIGSYLSFLKNAYFLHECERYDIKGKKILSGEKKFYLNDHGFNYFLSSSFDFSIGKYLENVIYLHLRRMGYKVYCGKIKGKEIDFIAEKNSEKKYIQAAYLLSDESVVEREFGNLNLIDDNYEKMVITLDDFNFGNQNGIRHINVWEFLY